MATNNLAVRKGRCINIGNCKKADMLEVIEINLGDEFACPECSGTLVEIKEKPFPKWVIYTMLALFGIGVVAVLWAKQCIGTQKPITNTEQVHTVDQGTVTPNPTLSSNEEDGTSENNVTNHAQSNEVNVTQLNDQLISTLIKMADNEGDKLSRIKMVEPTLNSFFVSERATVETYSQNGKTMLKRENARDFLEQVSTSFNVINFIILPESKTDTDGKYTFLKINEIYKQ